MTEKIYFLNVLIVFLFFNACSGCSNVITPTIWKNLDIYSGDDAINGVKKLDVLFKKKQNRSEAINFIKNKLVSSQTITHNDQLKLAIIFRCLKKAVSEVEYKNLSALIEIGQKYPDYYGMVLSVEPPYILDSIGVFKNKKKMVGHFPSPDGQMVEYNIKRQYLHRLIEATNKDFGYNYSGWGNWWLEKGQYLRFDKDTMQYSDS